jgi:hypothetical protein
MNTFVFLADPSSGMVTAANTDKANLGHIPGEIGLEVSYKIKHFKGSSTGPSGETSCDVCAVISGPNGF